MKKIIDILYVKSFKFSPESLSIEFENPVELEKLYFENVEIQDKTIQFDGRNLIIKVFEKDFEPYLIYHLTGKKGEITQHIIVKNHEEKLRFERFYDLGKIKKNDLHKIGILDDFGSLGIKFVPRFILDTYDRRLPLNAELSDLTRINQELFVTYTVEWDENQLNIFEKIQPFMVNMNKLKTQRISSTDTSITFGKNKAEIVAKFDRFERLKFEEDYVFGLEIGTYDILVKRTSFKLYKQFYPFYSGLRLIPEQFIEFTFTSNAGILINRKLHVQSKAKFPLLNGEYESKKFFNTVENSWLKSSYKVLEESWINESTYRNFLKKGEDND